MLKSKQTARTLNCLQRNGALDQNMPFFLLLHTIYMELWKKRIYYIHWIKSLNNNNSIHVSLFSLANSVACIVCEFVVRHSENTYRRAETGIFHRFTWGHFLLHITWNMLYHIHKFFGLNLCPATRKCMVLFTYPC